MRLITMEEARILVFTGTLCALVYWMICHWTNSHPLEKLLVSFLILLYTSLSVSAIRRYKKKNLKPIREVKQ